MTKRAITLGRFTALILGLTAALTGVAQAATPQHPSLASAKTSAATAPALQTTQALIGAKNYRITLHTGDRNNAGTDSDVYLRIYGTKGVTPEFYLDNTEDNYERNKYDRFDRLANDVGTLKTVCVRFDRLSGGSAGWYLDWVTVNGAFFQYYRWFETDQRICRSVT